MGFSPSLSFFEVIRFDPVKIHNEVKGDEGEQYAACGFMKDLERPGRQLIEKQNRYYLIDKQDEQNGVQNLVQCVFFHNCLFLN
jgi:hypothetical protein